MKLLVPVASGVETVVERQLYMLGYPNTKAHFGRIAINNADWTDVARLNMFLRSGERVLVCLGEFSATTFDELFDGVKAIAWADYIEPNARITVITKTVDSVLFAHNAIQGIGKKAIVSKLCNGVWDEFGAEYVVEIALRNNAVTVSLDTSGAGLHKRGYRPMAYSAPLRETTAAAMIDLSVWNPDKTFADLFCGSGTLPIEAVLKALKIAPGLQRDFAFTHWQCVSSCVYERAVQEAKDIRVERSLKIIGGDINPKAIQIAEQCAKAAGVDKYIKFNLREASQFVSRDSYGVSISNPPYGERIGNLQEVKEITRSMGKLYRSLDKWSFYYLSPYEDFERDFGKRADKKRYLFNAGIKCSYYSFLGPKPSKN